MNRVAVAGLVVAGLVAALVAPTGCVLPPIGDALLVCTADADCPTSQVCVRRIDDTSLCRPAGQPCVATIGGVTAEQDDGTPCTDVEGGICLGGACVVGRCGDGVVSGDETCDDDTDCRADCSRCGDGVLDAGEDCDEGDDNSDDEPGACRKKCVFFDCGDGVRDPNEACDDGEFNDDTIPGACRTSCLRAGCGDGVLDAGELCDEGPDNSDTTPGACRSTCVPGGCGDGVVDPGEVCDDGARNSDVQPNACRSTCVPARCGDRARDLDESCDDGDDNSDVLPNACRTSCTRASCGDHVVDDGELCDDGDDNSDTRADACRTSCVTPFCGDGVVDAEESCDDGDDNSDTRASACRTSCVPAGCGDGVIDVGEACDDGDLNDDEVANACRTDCTRATCGDGVLDDDEVCDDDNTVSGDGCRADCLKVEECDDGIIDPGEACDDDNDNPRDGCDACRRTTWAVSVPLQGRALVDVDGFALTNPGGVALDAVGGLYIADTGSHRVLRLDPDGSVVVIAGTGSAGFSGDGGPAIAAELRGPTDVAVAPDGVVFIADRLNDRIRSVDPDGTIRTFAGGATDNQANDGDGSVATFARLRRPRGVAASADAVVVAEENGGRLRGITRRPLPLIRTIAGNGGRDQVLGDGNDLFAGRLDRPVDVALDGANLLVVESGGLPRIRRVNLVQDRIDTVAGGGNQNPDTTPRVATSVSLSVPAGLTVGANEFFFTDQGHRRVFRVTGTQLVAVAGNGDVVDTDVTPSLPTALTTALRRPGGLTATSGRLIVADEGLHMIRAFSETAPAVTDLLGTGAPGFTLEEAAATSVTLVDPVAVVPAGDAVFIADAGARKIYRRDAGGLLTTIAGTGDVGQAVLGVPALQSPITPAALLRRTDGTLVVVEASPERVRILEITPEGVIVSLTEAAGIAVTSEGDLLLTMDSLGRVVLAGTFGIAVENPLLLSGDLPGFSVFQFSAEFVAIASESPTTVIAFNAGELQRITLDFGALSAIATTIDKGRFNEDGRAVAVSAEGIFVGGASDGVQLLRTNDTLALVVPGGPGRTGDGGPANGATIADPAALIVDDVGRLLIVDSGSGTIRRVGPAPSRVIETIAGDLHPSGPGALTQASLYRPQTLALLPDGGLVAGGAAGRLLHVDLTSPGGVTVVVGQPSPSPSPVAGPGGLTPARHLPLLPATTAFGFDPLDPIGPALKVVGERRVHRIDTTAAPTAWEASVNPPLNILLGASHIARVDADHIAVTDRAEHCVRRLRADTLALVDVLFGTCGSAGAFAGLVRDPGALVVDAEDGTVYLADTGNHRVLRRDPGGEVDVVIGDGSPSSAGQGSPARDFPLQSPGQLALDASGNLFIASTTTVRLVANVDGDANADGDDFVSTIYGRDNRDAFPQRDSRCLAGLVLDEAADRLIVADACGGFLVALDLVEVP